MESSNALNNKRIAKNTILLYFRMILMMLITLYTSRIVLQKLGVADYGIYNVVGGVVTLFSFISGAMAASTQRFLNYSMGQGDIAETRKVFNASQIIYLFIAALVILFAETIGLWFLYNKMVIPSDRLNAAFWTFQCSIIATSFLVISFPYNAVIIAREKMGAFAYVSILEAILKLVVVFFLGYNGFDKLIFYAVLLMFVQIIITCVYRIYCFRYFPETKFKVSDIKVDLYKSILFFSGWNLLGNIAYICLTQGTNILLNLFFGPSVNAAKGISVQVQNAVNSFCANFQTAQNPQIVKSYANGDMGYMCDLAFRASRFSFYLSFLFALPIMMKTDLILSVWLKDVPDYAAVFVQYTMCFSLVQSLANPLLTCSIATGNVKKIMSIVAVFFWSVIPFCYIVLKLGYSPISIFQVQLLLYLIAHIFRIYIVSNQVHFSKKKYVFDVLFPIMKVSIISIAVAFCLRLLFSTNTIIPSILYIVLIMIMCFFVIWYLGITKVERHSIVGFIFSKIKTKK